MIFAREELHDPRFLQLDDFNTAVIKYCKARGEDWNTACTIRLGRWEMDQVNNIWCSHGPCFDANNPRFGSNTRIEQVDVPTLFEIIN